MHPTLDVLENTILKAQELGVYRHIGAANFSGRIYGDDSLRRMWSMSPASQIYYSVLNPVFTALLPDLEKKNLSYPVTMFRDGIIDFIQHMIENPTPTGSGYLLDERLEPFVSEAWYECGLFYRLYYAPDTTFQLPSKKERIIVSTIANGCFVGGEKFATELALVKKFASDHGLRIEMHLPVRENIFFDHNYRDQAALFNISDLVFQILGNDVTFLSDKSVSMGSDYRNAYYHIPSDGALCLADNTLEHQFLTKGATPMVAKAQVQAGEFKVPLSTNHGVVITQRKRPAKCGELFNKLVKEAIHLKENASVDLTKHQFPYFAKQLTYGDFFHYVRTLIA